MRPQVYKEEGIVLQRREVGEADRILTVLTKSLGTLKVLAKGVKRPKSKKRGALEVFTHIKFSAVKLNGIDLMTEVEALESFSSFRKDIKKIALAYFFCEVVLKLTHPEEKNVQLFLLLLENLKKLRSESKLKTMRFTFAREALVILGFWPEQKELVDPDRTLQEISERKINTLRVGFQMLQ